MVVDIGIIWVMTDSSFEITECTGGITELHVYTGNLDPTLDE